MKRVDFLKYLRDQGCSLVLEGGKHSWWGNPVNHRGSSVPRHTEIDDRLTRKICRDLGIPSP